MLLIEARLVLGYGMIKRGGCSLYSQNVREKVLGTSVFKNEYSVSKI